MAQIANLDRLTLDSRVGARPSGMSYLRTNVGGLSVDCYGRRIAFPPRVSEALRFALNTSEFAVRELPGDLDDAGKLTLVRRLVREGLLMALGTYLEATHGCGS